ncbi:MAG TPA: iron-containing alcohol dehydrogenase [Candidatus Methylomirabilis sp.]|nr:iron-containing alcohol dehydrogenase [Candidatus Methylomirabilis sp.]
MGHASGMSGSLAFPPQERVIFGQGAVEQLAVEVDRLGTRRAFVITGTTIAKRTDLLPRVQEILGPRLAGIFFPISQHVPQQDVMHAALQGREARADVLVSLGGSSPVDGAKAVALCLSEGVVSEQQLHSYCRGPHQKPLRGQPLPHIALTTTLSAGEFTSGFAVTDERRRVKDLYGAPQFIPRVVILDPELTAFTPPWLWASTGMRAVDHAVERLYSPKHQPLVDALCIQALRYLFCDLPRSTREPRNLEVRLHCQLAAWMSAFGFLSVGTGISHAIGHQLGGHCNVPHGQTSCVILPHAMDFNCQAAADRLALVAEAAGIDMRDLSTRQAATAAIGAVRRLVEDLGCPMRLRDVGVKESDFPLLAEAVMDEAPHFENPRPIAGVTDIHEILRQAW